MPQFNIIALLSGFVAHVAYSGITLDVPIHNMVRHITQKYISGSQCVVIVTEKQEPLSDVELDNMPTLRVIVGEKLGDVVLYIEDSSTTDTHCLGKGAQAFERLLTQTLDARCLGFFVQVTNSTAIVHSFGRAVVRTAQRVPRNYVFFPSVQTKDMDVYAQDILNMTELDLMPNILIAKIHTDIPVPVSLDEALSLRKLYCSDTGLQLQGGGSETEEAYRQSSAFIENLCLSFKEHNNKDVAYLLHPKLAVLEQYDSNYMVLAIEIVTQRYVGFNPSEEVFLDIWMQFSSSGFFALCSNLFPDKILDLQGKPLTAITVPYDPFVIMYHYDDPAIYDGIEFLIFGELIRKFNGSLRVIYDPYNFWGAIFENGTGNGIVGNVLMGAADVGFAAMYMDWYYEWLWIDFSYPYVQSAAILVVPRPKLLPGFYVPVMPFSAGMWGAVGFSVLGISFFTWCLSAAMRRFLPGLSKKKSGLWDTFLDTLAMLVLQMPNETLEEWNYSPWKHYMTWLLIYFLLITSIYSGGLASILTVPSYKPAIETLVDLAESDINWTFSHEAATWAYRYSDNPVLRKIVSKFMRKTNEELAVTALRGDAGVYIEMLTGGAFGYGPYITTEAMGGLRLMKEPLYVSHVVLVTRKGGPYIQPLNDLILAMNQGGLGNYWQADVVRRFLSSRLQLLITLSHSAQDPDGDTPKTLQLSHVEGPFMLLTVGLAFSAIAFLAELVVRRYQQKSRH